MADLAVKMRGLRLARSRSPPRTASAWPSSSGSRRRPYRAWATHPEHVLVKELGRQKFYQDYRQVCEVVRESTFMRRAEPNGRAAPPERSGGQDLCARRAPPLPRSDVRHARWGRLPTLGARGV